MTRVLAYWGSCNIGDAIQTYALARLLPAGLRGVYRHRLAQYQPDGQFVVNGWLGNTPPATADGCLFAGVHVATGKHQEALIDWVGQRQPVGARDSYTLQLLASRGIAAELVHCATLTLPKYTGHRSGVWNIDADFAGVPGRRISAMIGAGMSWADQWYLAARRLHTLRTAELVYTNRLHTVFPCLAFGTPVVFPEVARDKVFGKGRLTALDDLGVVYGKPFTMDVTQHAEKYKAFVSRLLGIDISERWDVGDVPLPTA